jgi:Cysteine-rich secretory protein family
MGLDDELYLQKIEMEKKQKQRTNSTPRPPAALPQTSQRIQAYRTCPNCCTQISLPLASGRQMCRKCGWLGSAVKTVVAAPKPSPPVRDYGWEAIAWITAPFRQLRFLTHNTLWVRYALVLGLTAVVPVVLHFNEQARRGHPLDIHFFEAELSPQNLVGFYNGPGGKDWKIGSPLANTGNAYGLHSLPEMQSFALQLVNRDRILNGQSPLSLDPILSTAAQKHAEDMLQRDYFAHNTPEGQTPRDRFLAVGGSPYVGTGENIAYTTERLSNLNFASTEKFHKGWMYSNGHRENLLHPEYTHFGYGIVTNGIRGKSYTVQEFSTAEPLR